MWSPGRRCRRTARSGSRLPWKRRESLYFYVLDAMGLEGQRFAPMKGNAFILEPGQLRLHMSRPGQFYIEGGHYNDAVYNSWRRSAPYVEAQAEYRALIPAVDGETEAERRTRSDRYSAVFSRMMSMEQEGRAQTATTHPDPLGASPDH